MAKSVQRPESEAKVAAMFDRIAPRYDLLNRLLSMRQDQRWRKKMIAALPYRPGGALLDVATGTGDVLMAARAAHPEYASFTGVDISREMLALAEAKLAGAKPKAQLAKMSAEKLDLPDQSFDALTIAFGLRNVVQKPRALKEFARVLKPEGRLLVLEFFEPDNGLLAAGFQFYFHSVLPLIGGLISDRAAYKYLPRSVGSFYSADALRKALYDAGFVVDEIRSFMFGSCRLISAKRL